MTWSRRLALGCDRLRGSILSRAGAARLVVASGRHCGPARRTAAYSISRFHVRQGAKSES